MIYDKYNINKIELFISNIHLFCNTGQICESIHCFKTVFNLFNLCFYVSLLVLSSTTIKVEIVCGKKDWGIRTGESANKFKRIAELKTANEQVSIEIVIKQWEMMV